MHYPTPPSRPQARPVRRWAQRRRLWRTPAQLGAVSYPRHWCIGALVLLASVVALDASRVAKAVPLADAESVPPSSETARQPSAAPATDGLAVGVLPTPAGRLLQVQLTAYSASGQEGTAWGITRSATPVSPGVVAVDPGVIPLGSRLRIEGLPGVSRAEDTGGAVTGAHVDVFMPSRADALTFGRRDDVTVEVLQDGTTPRWAR